MTVMIKVTSAPTAKVLSFVLNSSFAVTLWSKMATSSMTMTTHFTLLPKWALSPKATSTAPDKNWSLPLVTSVLTSVVNMHVGNSE